jgi:hypothetical protein
MQYEMSESEHRSFADRIAATAIVNQAALKCLIGGLEATPDNIVLMIGDFINPELPEFAGLIEAIMQAVDEVTTMPRARYVADGENMK